jgi:hypothetical protein
VSDHTAALASLPWRGPGEDRPELPIPPERMPLRFDGTWRKSWRYVAAFGERFMLSGARVEMGPLGQCFWALLDRGSGEILERTRMLLPFERGEVWTEGKGGTGWQLGTDVAGARTRIESGELFIRMHVGDGDWAEAVCSNGGGGYVWTRKRISEIRCDLQLPGGEHVRETMRGIEDESAGYHPRHTVWSWSAGVGTARDGRAVGWNLVEGVNDPPERSERAVWVEGEAGAREPGPVRFQGLEAIDAADGSRLEFEAEAERSRSESKLLVKYSYRQPFGTFAGTLPGGIELASGIGVMEHHDALW